MLIPSTIIFIDTHLYTYIHINFTVSYSYKLFKNTKRYGVYLLVNWVTTSVKGPKPAEFLAATLNSYLVSGFNSATIYLFEVVVTFWKSSPRFLYSTS